MPWVLIEPAQRFRDSGPWIVGVMARQDKLVALRSCSYGCEEGLTPNSAGSLKLTAGSAGFTFGGVIPIIMEEIPPGTILL